MFKVNNKKTNTTSLTSFWCFIVDFEHILHFFFIFTIADFEQVNVSRVVMFSKLLVMYLGMISNMCGT